MPVIRPAVAQDVDAICAFDHIAQTDDGGRRRFIERSIADGSCFVVIAETQVAAYGVLEYSFYEQGFIAMLYVDARWRRQRYGHMLLTHIEARCRTSKLFTSTNLSNLPMQALLAKLGYRLRGVLHNLDEHDPELVYFKALH